MSDPIIKIENLGKSYFIGHERQKGYTALRDVLTQKARGIAKGIKDTISGAQLIAGQDIEEFWALKDINFTIEQGEAVGIIGRNGAGKSTLLKVLSRITEPTKGKITLKGRVASLLEVGTGFHPELSGRENIYLNGAILGMSRSEIKKKFDEIVDFSGVEKFLDTPVKRYSSGMYVRLAFSVAAHLEPEILVVDEVLAVGDAEFQKKCLGKMNDVSHKEGRTVLFVSHNMGAISQLCTKGIFLSGGRLQYEGDVNTAIAKYTNASLLNASTEFKVNVSETNYFEYIGMENADGEKCDNFVFDENLVINIKIKIEEWHPTLELSTSVYTKLKNRIFTLDVSLKEYYREDEFINLKITIPKGFLVPGIYSWLICINHPHVRLFDLRDDICGFTILETGSVFSKYDGMDYGSVYPPNCKIEVVNDAT